MNHENFEEILRKKCQSWQASTKEEALDLVSSHNGALLRAFDVDTRPKGGNLHLVALLFGFGRGYQEVLVVWTKGEFLLPGEGSLPIRNDVARQLIELDHGMNQEKSGTH